MSWRLAGLLALSAAVAIAAAVLFGRDAAVLSGRDAGAGDASAMSERDAAERERKELDATLGQGDSNVVRWTDRTEVASGEAYQGPWRMNESDFRYVDGPTVAMDREGAVAVAWSDEARQDVFFQLYDPDGEPRLEEPVNVSRSPGIFSWLPRMAIGGGEPGEPLHVYLLWQDIVFSGGSHGGEIFFARSTNGGRTFSRPVNLSNTPAGAGKGRLSARHWHNGSLDLARGPDGDLYAAWTEYEGALRFRRSGDEGASFGAELVLAGGNAAAAAHQPARGPALAVDGETVYLAWTVGEDPAADIRLARSEDGGRSFGEPLVLESPGHADAPGLAVDGEGRVHLVYAESPDGPLGRYGIRYTRSTGGARSFETPREIAGPDDAGVESVSFPELALDEEDRIYVLWHLFPDRRDRPRGLALTTSDDGGRGFAPPAVVPGTADPELGFTGSLQGLLMRKLAVNGRGELAVVNSTFLPNRESRVRLIRGKIGGEPAR